MTIRQFNDEIRRIIRRNIEQSTPEKISNEVRDLAKKAKIPLAYARELQREAERNNVELAIAEFYIKPELDKINDVVDAYPSQFAEIVRRADRERWDEQKLLQRLNNFQQMRDHHLRTAQRTIQAAVARLQIVQLAEQLNNANARYSGPLRANTRPECKTWLNQVRPMSEWMSLKNRFGQIVAIHCGGYNCAHRLVIVR